MELPGRDIRISKKILKKKKERVILPEVQCEGFTVMKTEKFQEQISTQGRYSQARKWYIHLKTVQFILIIP